MSDRSPTKILASFYTRYALWILLGFALASPAVFIMAIWAIGTNSNRIADWLPSHFEETATLAQFNEWFSDGFFVVVSWDGCQLDLSRDPEDTSGDDPRLDRLVKMLVPDATQTSEGPPTTEAKADEVAVWLKDFQSGFDRASAREKSVSPPTPEECGKYFIGAVTSRSLLQTLTRDPLAIPYPEAVRRLTGNLVGKEGQASAIFFLNDLSTDNLREVIGFHATRWIDRGVPQGILYRALEACDIPLDSVYVGGPPIDNLSINEEGQRTLLRLALAAGFLGLVLAWLSLRSVVLTLIVFLSGILSTGGATAAIWVSGFHADAIVLAMPSLVYVLTISGAVHLVNYYRKAVESEGIAGAAGRAIAMGMKPAILCSATTAFGLLSLYASDLVPIRRFGMFSALGMGLMLVVLFLFLPAALEYFGQSILLSKPKKSAELADGPSSIEYLERFGRRYAKWIIARHRLVNLTCAAVIAFFAGGVQYIQTSVDLLKLFDDGTRILHDYKWLEQNVGNLVPLEVLVRFEPQLLAEKREADTATTLSPAPMTMLERATMVNHVQQAIAERFGEQGSGLISPPMSALTFLPALPTEHRGTAAVVRRKIMNSKFQQSRQALEASGFLRTDEKSGAEIWRISLRVAAFKQVDYGLLASDIREVVDPLIAEANTIRKASALPVISAIHTGGVPIVYKAQRELLNSLIESTVWSFLTITPLVIWVTGGVRSGLVAMLPNVLPVIAVFGGMGWLGIPVDIGSMMTASIALGVAVDDTIHFLCWYRHCRAETTLRDDAIVNTFGSCFVPTIQASVINGLGLSVFFLSTFNPTKQFGLLMLVILTCGAFAELVMLPAILASRLGNVFDQTVTLRTRIQRIRASLQIHSRASSQVQDIAP